jgi:hypothetical protein
MYLWAQTAHCFSDNPLSNMLKLSILENAEFKFENLRFSLNLDEWIGLGRDVLCLVLHFYYLFNFLFAFEVLSLRLQNHWHFNLILNGPGACSSMGILICSMRIQIVPGFVLCSHWLLQKEGGFLLADTQFGAFFLL